MKVDALASLRNYEHHIEPVWAALPAEVRGTFIRPGQPIGRRDPSRFVLVASLRDAQSIGGDRLIHLCHGAGQTYVGHERNGSYPGGDGLDGVRLFLTASERVAGLWRERYAVPAVAIGCPRLDRHARGAAAVTATASLGHQAEGRGRPTVAISFHWACSLVPETMSAWRYYDPHLPRLVRDPRFRVVGHGHPRLWPTIRRRWAELGVDQWPDVDRVLSESDVVVADNTSLLYEACAVGIPTVCLNIPSYRREVEHSGRFWSHPPGPQVDHPTELADAIACALADPPAHRAIRARAVAWAYGGPITGDASERAAAAIMEVLDGRP